MLPHPLGNSNSKYHLIFLLLFSIAVSGIAYSQISPRNVEKLSPTLRSRVTNSKMPVAGIYVIAVSDTLLFREYAIKRLGVSPNYTYNTAGIFIIRCSSINKTSFRGIIESIRFCQDERMINIPAVLYV